MNHLTELLTTIGLRLTAAQLLFGLGRQDSARTLDARLRYYSSISLLGVDEIGYLSYDSRNADLLFQVISRRYERKSLISTTNLSFSAWPTVFPNATSATARIDGVIHHAEILTTRGRATDGAKPNSLRRRAEQRQANDPNAGSENYTL